MDFNSGEPRAHIRAPSLKRGKNDNGLNERIKLKKVLGLTVCSNAALDVSPTTGVIAYPAGCTVVLFNVKKLSQAYLLNTSRKAITAVAYSQCGRYIATGECGQNPAIKVWELDSSAVNGNIELPGGNNVGGVVIAEFLGHKYATSCITFSPNGKYLVSVGSQHDMIVNVFDWRQNLKIASNKVSAKVCSVCFSEDGNYFVTVGNRHVKYWYLEGSRKYKEPIPLMGRSAILGELRNNDFCAVACGKGDAADSTYAITRNGQLVEFNSRRLLDKWVDCRTTSANCLSTSGQFIFVGCAESIIRVFNAENLEYMTTLPRTHYLGVDVAQGVHINHITSAPPNSKYPDTIAMVYDEVHAKLTCVYNDHSLYIWDLRNIQRVGKSHSFLYHSACIWGVETVPYNTLKNHLTHNLPTDCFLTCSSDDTIRVWNIDGCETNEVYRKNIYSKDLLKLLYIDPEMNYIKDMDNPILNMEKSSSYDGRNGVRCIKVSPERSHLATGDRSGNIRIYHLGTLKLLTTIEAHDSEVLCLEYTNDKIERRLLASASRDRLIHVFDVDIGYQILQTLDDHSSSITSVKFIGSGLTFQMVSCGADKSIIFRNFQQNQFLRGNNCSGKTTLYDMEVDSNNKHILTACQDRNIRIYGTQNAKHTKTFKGSHSDEGSLIKLSLDLSGIYIATSCTDKTLSVYDYYSTECMARMYGHSELVTGLKFTNDCKHLISASGDGCIFIWQVPHDMIVTMQARLSQQAIRSGGTIPRPIASPTNNEMNESPSYLNHKNIRPPEQFQTPTPNFFTEDVPISPGYRFSDVGQLPQWAKKKTPTEENADNVLSSSPSQSNQPQPKTRGRWAQKGPFEPDELRATSPGDATVSSTTPPIPTAISYTIPIIQTNHHNNNQTSDYNSASSKDIYTNTYLSEDSSIDSGVENRRDLLLVNKNTPKGSLQFESNTEHDGDIEDISDGERTSSDHGMTFYPNVPGTPTGDFKVNAMNEEELRKSVRRQKFEKQGLSLTASQSGTNTGTGTSDDEDDASTPSGDNAERSLASTLGGSNENIPLQQSTSFLQAALDGPGSLSDRSDRKRRSISSKHNNSDVKPNYTKSFANSKKEELMKVINEAKQKLENGQKSRMRDANKQNTIQTQTIHEVGYRSTLRASQSISDLTHSANLDRARLLNRLPQQGFKSQSSHSYKPIASSRQNTNSNRVAAKRNSTLSSKMSTNGMGTRSVSSGTLNHASDSDPEAPVSRGGILRPTIASQNRMNGASSANSKYNSTNKTAAAIINRRRGLTSSVSVSSGGQDDSSSEEAQTNTHKISGNKPVVPPRPRGISGVEYKRNGVPNVTTNGKPNKTTFNEEVPCKDNDIANADLSSQLISNIISQLMVTTNSVMQLHQRLKTSEESSNGTDNRKQDMLKELENAVMMTQSMLTKITNKPSERSGHHVTFAKNDSRISTQQNGEYTQMMDKCTDILQKVQKHVQNNNI
ncbi:mitogen-activated protein kinase-binding protein 1 isoform X6 [Sitodiplosis mosellana]|uniref:mitogen-activated protein kinase-binding protein 1 isoform X6 n=1 Tax=Sitodiplosis mosellana TaxID=263140 RepID=UPI002444C9C6|nr:mitogen-activated protein kinase-binding protein 1 isoform X6 [Sitodiplosis mosellana]